MFATDVRVEEGSSEVMVDEDLLMGVEEFGIVGEEWGERVPNDKLRTFLIARIRAAHIVIMAVGWRGRGKTL